MSRYLEFTKLAFTPTEARYPTITKVPEGNGATGRATHPMQQKTQGGNGSYGMSTDNSPSTSISQTTTSPGPTGSVKLWAPQQQQINAHPHSSGASLMGFGSYTNLANSTTVTTQPAVNKAVTGMNANNLEQAQVNIANTGQYGDRTTMNRIDFQTPGPVVNKVDTLASAARALDCCLEKLASYVYDPSETHFQRILRKEGEKAIAAGDMDKATKLAVASNALACLESVVAEETAEDKTAAGLKERGIKLLINDAVMKAAKDGSKNIFAAGQKIVRNNTLPMLDSKGRPIWDNIANHMTHVGLQGPRTTVTPNAARRLMQTLGNPRLRAFKQWIYENPWKGNLALGLGTGAAVTGAAAALPTIDDPQNIFSRTYNKLVEHPLQTGVSAGLLAPLMATGALGMNQSVNQPAVQNMQNLAGIGGSLTLGHNLLRADMEKGRESAANDFFGITNRKVKSNVLRNTGLGAGMGALGGLVAATAANRNGNLGYDLGDYMKYTLGGAALGGLGGYMSDSFGTNYDKDQNYTE